MCVTYILFIMVVVLVSSIYVHKLIVTVLQIHVQLGGVWKESLSELSGGQKSLVALALVLSLCMYNPGNSSNCNFVLIFVELKS